MLLLLGIAPAVWAATPLEILDHLQAQTGTVASLERGKQLYHGQPLSGGKSESCATCHTANPRDPGRHARTNKTILPLAPSVTADRFSDPEKVEKWFKRNCNEVLGRLCTTQGKADFVAYLISVR
jgi:cytochrome c peroxidase